MLLQHRAWVQRFHPTQTFVFKVKIHQLIARDTLCKPCREALVEKSCFAGSPHPSDGTSLSLQRGCGSISWGQFRKGTLQCIPEFLTDRLSQMVLHKDYYQAKSVFSKD
jgi:hypothetical protein